MKNKKIWFFLSLLCLLSGGLFVLLGTLLGGIPGFYLDKNGIHTSRETASQTMNEIGRASCRERVSHQV